MKPSKNRVVITGVGIVSPLGITATENWLAITNKQHGFVALSQEMKEELKVPLVGAIPEEKIIPFLKNRKMIKYMGKDALLCIKAAGEALVDAKWEDIPGIRESLGLYVATGLTYSGQNDLLDVLKECVDETGFSLKRFGESGLYRINPLMSFQSLSNMGACNVSIEFGLTGENLVFSSRVDQAASAFIEAFEAIGRGELEAVLVGATETKLHNGGIGPMRLEEALYEAEGTEEYPVKPFDKNRNGCIPSEGGAFLFLETLDSAVKRGAKVYAEIIGYGRYNSFTYFGEDSEAACKGSMEDALQMGGLKREECGLLVSSAGGEPEKDELEGRSIESVFAGTPLLTWAPKAYYGEMGVGSVMVATALAATALCQNVVPPSIGTQECAFDLVLSNASGQEPALTHAMVNAFDSPTTKSAILLKALRP